MSEFFIPTKAEIQAVEVGSLAPDPFGRMSEVVEVFAKELDVNGKLFVCFYTKIGDGSSISNSLKEDELHRHVGVCRNYTSHELDDIEQAELLARKRETALPASVDFQGSMEDWL